MPLSALRHTVLWTTLIALSVGIVSCGSDTGDDGGAAPEAEQNRNVVASPLATELHTVIDPIAESLLETSLTLEEASEQDSDSVLTVSLRYSADPPLPEDCVASLSTVVEQLGGAVDESFMGCGESHVDFTGALIGERVVDGAFEVADGLLATLILRE